MAMESQEMEKIKKKIGLYILNFNGIKWLKICLPNVVKFCSICEIFIIDNNSKDGSVEFVKEKFPAIIIKKNKSNYGFSRGYNKWLLSKSEHKYVIIMNNDVIVTENWLEPIINYMRVNNIDIVQPKIKNIKWSRKNNYPLNCNSGIPSIKEIENLKTNSFDYAGACGGFLDFSGIPFCRGRILNFIENDLNQYDNISDIFWASGCCLIIKKDLFEKLNGFDEDFFMHFEEIDLCWRAHAHNKRIICFPQSKIYHFGGGSLRYGDSKKRFYNHRNSLLLIIKNLEYKYFIFAFFLRIIIDWALILFFLIKCIPNSIKGKLSVSIKDAISIILAHINVILFLPKFIRKRSPIKSKKIYYRSILIDFFILGRKTFKDLK